MRVNIYIKNVSSDCFIIRVAVISVFCVQHQTINQNELSNGLKVWRLFVPPGFYVYLRVSEK